MIELNINNFIPIYSFKNKQIFNQDLQEKVNVSLYNTSIEENKTTDTYTYSITEEPMNLTPITFTIGEYNYSISHGSTATVTQTITTN